jgi:hypothetical protein
VIELVDEDARKFGDRAVESDPTLTEEGGGVHGTAEVVEAGDRVESDGVSAELRKMAGESKRAPEEFAVVGMEKGRHSGLEYRPINAGRQKFRRSDNWI